MEPVTVPLMAALQISAGNPPPPKPIKIDMEDIIDEIHFWESAVVCFVIEANPPLHIIDGYARRIRKDLAIDKIGMVEKGVFLIRFHSQQDRISACEMNGILFDKKPFIVKPWTPSMSYSKYNLSSLPIWVKFPGFDDRYWGEKSLTKIASMLGPVLRVDGAKGSDDVRSSFG